MSKRKSYEEVKSYIELFGYKLLSKEYINAHQYLLIQCDKGHKYKAVYNAFQQGKRCPYCNGGVRLEYEYVKEYIESFGYKLLSTEYKNAHIKLSIKCPNNHEYKVRFNDFQSGNRCPYCDVSKGEQRIINWLEENNIKYIYEKTFKKLLGVGGGNLSYDFYLPKYNLLIEYQGEQHKYKVEGFGNFEIQQEHDKRKREYAETNNLKLLEIWYWDFDNIENILEKELF